jgi:hypothetical protein
LNLNTLPYFPEKTLLTLISHPMDSSEEAPADSQDISDPKLQKTTSSPQHNHLLQSNPNGDDPTNTIKNLPTSGYTTPIAKSHLHPFSLRNKKPGSPYFKLQNKYSTRPRLLRPQTPSVTLTNIYEPNLIQTKNLLPSTPTTNYISDCAIKVQHIHQITESEQSNAHNLQTSTQSSDNKSDQHQNIMSQQSVKVNPLAAKTNKKKMQDEDITTLFFQTFTITSDPSDTVHHNVLRNWGQENNIYLPRLSQSLTRYCNTNNIHIDIASKTYIKNASKMT